jgi:hypothetical protein
MDKLLNEKVKILEKAFQLHSFIKEKKKLYAQLRKNLKTYRYIADVKMACPTSLHRELEDAMMDIIKPVSIGQLTEQKIEEGLNALDEFYHVVESQREHICRELIKLCEHQEIKDNIENIVPYSLNENLLLYK